MNQVISKGPHKGIYRVFIDHPDSVHSGKGLRKVLLAPMPRGEHTSHTKKNFFLNKRIVRTSQKQRLGKTKQNKLCIRSCLTLRATK